jgi:hypothetical protein
LTDTFAGEPRVGVAVQLADELAAVAVSELERDLAGVELQDVPGVPAEVVAGGGIGESDRADDAVLRQRELVQGRVPLHVDEDRARLDVDHLPGSASSSPGRMPS